ncbi:MAG: pyruvate carboxylase [Alphaproteobacteria bacterium]|nr:MAG: pyruvate carboxylase [Alphaproteobacteria bacterium]
MKRFKKLLVANRGEIAIRVFRAATELGIRTVAIYAEEDRLSLHRIKADEAYLVGKGKRPIDAYLDIDDIIRVARRAGADAIHPGYGFLSESPEFADACAAAGIVFVGPSSDIMRRLGNKVQARELAKAADVPVMPATDPLPEDNAQIKRLAAEIGYPVMLKASWGGGGRGMRVIASEDDLLHNVAAARREARAAFGKDEVYLEKLVERARHVEVQILGDSHGKVVHLYERDCSVQRRHQKVVERAPAPYLSAARRQDLCEAALRLARHAGYVNAGTVEFLQDADTGAFYFIEVNPRIQVEHTVTEAVTGLDIVKAQIAIAAGAAIGAPESGIPDQEDIPLRGHALQCRVTTEDPRNNFIPDYGQIVAYRSPSGPGIRLDGGTAYSGALITRHFDSLLVKVTAWGPNEAEALSRMRRALFEFRIRGVETNLLFLETLIDHPSFAAASYTTRFIDETPELFHFPRRRDRATRLLRFIGEVIVNGNPEVKGRPAPARLKLPELPEVGYDDPPAGSRQKLEKLGPEKFAEWMLDEKRVLVTDTTFRDAHQSLLATRMRSYDMERIAPVYARLLPQLLSVECWGGATFDVAMRFLHEDPWQRLANIREKMPNVLTQMLLRASNAVGYTNYPDNVVRAFVHQAANSGVDIFRVFDSLNWVDNMRVAMEAVRETGKICEAAICYTGDLTDPDRSKYDLKYYVTMARELEKAGAHVLGIKDMAGLCKPEAARRLVSALKQEIGLPIHFHTHDTSGISAASVLAAVEAGADAVDAAIDSMSGLTSQPNLGSIVEALRNTDRDTGLDPHAIRELAIYWEQVRAQYAAFESDIRSGASEVYLHEMPGGQYTNLREQARSLGIESRWHDVAKAYAAVNRMFGDIVKVTPSSKVVGDMALMMVTSDLTEEDVLDPDTEIAFPDSVVSFFKGEIGQPPGGFPEALQKKVLKGEKPLTVRPGEVLEPLDLDAARKEVEAKIERSVSDTEFASYLMYPKVFLAYAETEKMFGDVSVLDTPTFFYGMEPGQEITVTIAQGQELIIRFLAVSDVDDEGQRSVFFELNGQPRSVKITDKSKAATKAAHRKAEPGNPAHVGAPMPGLVASVAVKPGQKVERGDTLLTLEAMKMETAIRADHDGVVEEVLVQTGTQVDAKDLLMVVEPGK